jgi:hypothetical protein
VAEYVMAAPPLFGDLDQSPQPGGAPASSLSTFSYPRE